MIEKRLWAWGAEDGKYDVNIGFMYEILKKKKKVL